MEAKILLVVLISFLVGTGLGPLVEVDYKYLLVVAVAVFIFGLTVNKPRGLLVISFALAALIISIANYSYRADQITKQARSIQDTKATFRLLIDDMPSKTAFGQKVQAKVIQLNGESSSVNVNLYAPKFPELSYGQIIEVEGKISGFNDSPQKFIKEGQVGSISVFAFKVIEETKTRGVKYYLLKIRENFNASVDKLLPSDESNLAQGLIMGERAVFSDKFKGYLQNSGTTHIIALSGYNITIILGVFLVVRKYFSKLVNLLIPVAFICLFIIMTGASASIVRAGIMGLMPLLARHLGRGSQSLIAIILSATIMVAINPFILLYDVGFQLSFAAIVGVVYIAPKFKFNKSLPSDLSSILSETLGAQIATLPIIVYYFGSVSIVSPIANLAILWLVPSAMLLSFLTGVVGLISATLGSIVSLPASALLSVINYLIEFFGNMPFAARSLQVENPIWILIYYLVVIDFFFIFRKGERVRPT